MVGRLRGPFFYMRSVLLAALSAYLLATPLLWMPVGIEWHDQQRWFQLLLLAGAFIYAAWRPWAWQPLLRRPGAFVTLVVALGAGLLASAFAAKPGWAVMEVALTLGLIQLALLIAWAYVQHPVTGRAFTVTLGAVAALLTTQTLAALLAAYVQRMPLDPWLLLSGFANIRFFGQVVTAIAPLLVAGWMLQSTLRWRRTLAALAMLWCWTGWLSGTRGTWLAAAVCAVTAALLPFPVARQWARRFVAAWVGGLVIYLLTHGVIPRLLAVDVVQPITDRLTLDSSGRWMLWQVAAQEWWHTPWLGIGPMHLANIPTLPNAHPHNIVLQWLAEWGVIATLAWVLLLGGWLLHLLWRVPQGHAYAAWPETQRTLYWGVCMGLWGSAAQSLVDGNLVMPYPQTVIVVLAGLALGMTVSNTQPWPNLTPSSGAVSRRSVVTLRLVLLCSGAVVLHHLWVMTPTLEQRPHQCLPFCGGPLPPRLWSQGMIAWDDDLYRLPSRISDIPSAP
jgi:putative inorganic carbon (HCO3(-)) transporter